MQKVKVGPPASHDGPPPLHSVSQYCLAALRLRRTLLGLLLPGQVLVPLLVRLSLEMAFSFSSPSSVS